MEWCGNLFVAVMVVGVFCAGRDARAQVVSVRCCTEQSDLEKIGTCLSGPDSTNLGVGCATASVCVLGFGEDSSLMPLLCNPDATDVPTFLRGFCSESDEPSATIYAECVGRSIFGADLSGLYDDDSDGDLDLADLAGFMTAYDVTPKLEQSDAVLVSVECCVSEAVVQDLSLCLTGPGPVSGPFPCERADACTLGFSQAIEPGDLQYKQCRPDLPLPDPTESAICESWSDGSVPPAFRCAAAHFSTFRDVSLLDGDADGDVDLHDAAMFMVAYHASEP